MSIPARPDVDPDLVIGDGLSAALELLEEARRYYLADGSFVELAPEAVVELRKLAAVRMGALHFAALQVVSVAPYGLFTERWTNVCNMSLALMVAIRGLSAALGRTTVPIPVKSGPSGIDMHG